MMKKRQVDGLYLSEESIRPYRLVKKKKKFKDWDRNFLLKHKRHFIEINCPACSSKKHKFYFRKLGIRYELCQQCKTVFINPRPSLELLRRVLKVSKEYFFWNKYIFPRVEEARREGICKPRVKQTIMLANKFLPRYDSILEIGAGYGTFCEELKKTKRFKKIIALEPSPGFANSCRKKGLKTLEMPVEDISGSTKVDVIVSFEVIEHLFSPSDFLKKSKQHLKKRGLIILTCPNFQGFDFRILGVKYGNINHTHLNYFNPKSLSFLLTSGGFKIMQVLTPGQLDADIVRQYVLRKRVSLENRPFLKEVLINRWQNLGRKFQRFLADNLLSGHMWVVAKKNK